MKKLLIVPFVILAAIIAIYGVDNMNEVKLEVKGGYIYGSILEPKNNSKNTIVIITAGSGPTDRDGNSTILEGRNDSLKYLAYQLKERGIASFRYDQRSSGKSYKSLKDKNIKFDFLVDDLVECIRYIKEKEDFNNIYLIGHSQGALISVLAAQREKVDGVVTVAGAARTIDKILLEQIKRQDQELANILEEELDKIRAGEESNSENKEIKQLLSGENGEFIRRWMEYNPAKEVKKLDIPVYFIYGTSDLQVKPDAINYLDDIIDDSNFRILENMNHVLKVSPEDEKENYKRYTFPGYPLHPDLVNTIEEFIAG